MSIEKFIAAASKIEIVSGEGAGVGTVEQTTIKTLLGIKRRLTAERCGGDRWAHAIVTMADGAAYKTDGASLDQIA
jgi:hypothetical protein